ncbi:MAG: flagellar motor protein MotA [Deltaproteobacteria bacterium]|nr:MAG: flagellar motor protein MotA [Deltaproteobacteria bacterium]
MNASFGPMFARLLLAQTPPPAATPDYGFFAAILHAGLGEKLVMAVLLMRRASRQSESFLQGFYTTQRLDATFQKSEMLTFSPVSQVFRAGYIELAKIRKARSEAPGQPDKAAGDLESVERALRRAAAGELTGLESLVPFLATCGATAPFIGLFGTVIGIINSFRDIGMMGNANLATVAPGIGGALVATAFGLFAAIPAVMAYNFFLSRIRVLETEMQNFSADFLNIIKRHFF